ncbi:hypothetical protein CGSMWGv55152_05067 [Gardnerella vaginalis 55152]|uniref:Uncharacterized protein n=1 Tax=Gardnerella vaginalis 55152 TaxID=698955 RepID=I4LRW2_GARVA|nr:hypothetical protein CGSMWGv55152_05067 [Gardnerella vaginalis 55152]
MQFQAQSKRLSRYALSEKVGRRARVCSQNHQIQLQNQEHFPAFVYPNSQNVNKCGHKETNIGKL